MNKLGSKASEGTHVNVQAMLEETECWDEELDDNAQQFG